MLARLVLKGCWRPIVLVQRPLSASVRLSRLRWAASGAPKATSPHPRSGWGGSGSGAPYSSSVASHAWSAFGAFPEANDVIWKVTENLRQFWQTNHPSIELR